MFSIILTILIGCVFLFSSVVKINDAISFLRHIARLDIFPRNKSLSYITVIMIGMETGLSAALLFYSFPKIVIPATIGILLFFIILTYWSTSTGKVEDCGCYGGILAIEPKTSMLLDIIYIAILIVAYIFSGENDASLIQIVVPVMVIIITPFVAYKSYKEPFYDLSRLKAGNKWRKSWIEYEKGDISTGEYFIVFLGKSCPYCKRWVPLMNIMNTQQDLPTVVGAMELDDKGIEEFKTEHLIGFPVIFYAKSFVEHNDNRGPTACLIKDGVIIEKWEGKLPEEYALRIKNFYESIIKTGEQFCFCRLNKF